jgi:hypothetical protein
MATDAVPTVTRGNAPMRCDLALSGNPCRTGKSDLRAPPTSPHANARPDQGYNGDAGWRVTVGNLIA